MEHDEIEFSTNKADYEMLEVLGQGATAQVQVAKFTHPRTGVQKKCAVKRIQCEKFFTSLKSISTEVGLMLKCRHENIVNYYTSFVVKSELWIVMALHSGGSFFDIIKQRLSKPEYEDGLFDETELATVLKGALAGLDYLHTNGQIHRDLKAGNILLGGDGSIALADFGVSALLNTAGDSSGDAKKGTFVGTPCWMAPEVMEQENGYDLKADIWSFGIVAIELATGHAPYAKFPPMKVIMLTMQNPGPTLDKTRYKKYSKEFRKMIERCLKKDPTERPTAKELLKDKFFKKAKEKEKSKPALQALLSQTPIPPKGIKPRRVPGSSGRLKKCPDGTWEFSDDELEQDTNQFVSLLYPKVRSPKNTLAPEKESTRAVELKLSLRIRNPAGQLQDISFPFEVGKDTPALVAQEMMQNRIIEGDDIVIVASNIEDLIDAVIRREVVKKEVSFRVRTGIVDNIVDAEMLKGFAKLSVEI